MRQTQLVIILGTNGTGKTTFLKKLINKVNKRRILIVTPDPMEWQEIEQISRKEIHSFEGTKRLIYREGDMQLLAKKASNAIIIFDDFKAFFITKRDEINALRTLAIRRRQRMLDIFIVAHGFTEVVPSFLLTFASKFILFRTLDNIARVKNRLMNYELLLDAQKRINSKDKHYYEIIKVN